MIKKYGKIDITEHSIWITHFHFEGEPEHFQIETILWGIERLVKSLRKELKLRAQAKESANGTSLSASPTTRTDTPSATPHPRNRKSKKA